MKDKNKLEEKHAELEDQIAKGQINIHSTLSRISDRINELEAVIYGINNALIEQEIIPSNLLYKKVDSVKTQMIENGQNLNAGITVRIDDENAVEQEVNCEERLHICKAVCCKLNFPLNENEIDSGHYKWQLGKPYYIRQQSNGACCYLGESGKCGVYSNRPKICRIYSCHKDERIWKDFDNMVLNTEWIGENLPGGMPD